MDELGDVVGKDVEVLEKVLDDCGVCWDMLGEALLCGTPVPAFPIGSTVLKLEKSLYVRFETYMACAVDAAYHG